jgi:hypothetical protein
VHNFLHRTGLASVFGRRHTYGPECYGPRGCAQAIERLAGLVNARDLYVD